MWDVGVDTIQVSGRMFLTTFASKLFRIFIETQEILFLLTCSCHLPDVD